VWRRDAWWQRGGATGPASLTVCLAHAGTATGGGALQRSWLAGPYPIDADDEAAAPPAGADEAVRPQATMTTEEERRAHNEVAWRDCGGYETSSGCPCWDESPYICIPKHTLGFNPNFFAIFCCCLCRRRSDVGDDDVYSGVARGATGADKN
jgi:hypothetical protein